MPLECFLDESEWQQLNIYFVGVLAIEATNNLNSFNSEMQEILDYARKITGDSRAEIHAQEIYGGSGCYKGVSPSERVAIFRKVTDVLTRLATKICIKPIASSKILFASDHKHVLALVYACEHIEIICKDSWRLTSDNHQQLNFKVTKALEEARTGRARNCVQFKKLTACSPAILHSNQSLGLQACDTALYVVGRYQFNCQTQKTGRESREIRRLYNALKDSGKLLIKNSWPA